MRKHHYIVTSILLTFALYTYAVGAKAETCMQIRERIVAQQEGPPKANADLLQRIAARTDCRFSAPEIYRAAYGNKPFPKVGERGRRARNDEDD